MNKAIIEKHKHLQVEITVHTPGKAVPTYRRVVPMAITFCRIDGPSSEWHLTFIDMDTGLNESLPMKRITGWGRS